MNYNYLNCSHNKIFKTIVNKFDSYRTYKYDLLPGAVHQIIYRFNSYPLNQIWLNPDAYKINKNEALSHKPFLKKIDSKEVFDEDLVEKSLKAVKETKDIANKSMMKSFKEKTGEEAVKNLGAAIVAAQTKS